MHNNRNYVRLSSGEEGRTSTCIHPICLALLVRWWWWFRLWWCWPVGLVRLIQRSLWPTYSHPEWGDDWVCLEMSFFWPDDWINSMKRDIGSKFHWDQSMSIWNRPVATAHLFSDLWAFVCVCEWVDQHNKFQRNYNKFPLNWQTNSDGIVLWTACCCCKVRSCRDAIPCPKVHLCKSGFD